MKILQVGCGKMGGALLSRWLEKTSHDFTVAKQSRGGVPAGAEVFTSAGDVPDNMFDMVIIAVKPQMIADVMPAYQSKIKDTGCIFSMAAGASCANLTKATGTDYVVRVMPNLPVLIGEGVSGLYATEACLDAHRALAQELTEATGDLIWTDSEDELDRLTAVAGSGPGYMFEMMRLYVAAAMSLGFSEETARRLVLGTVRGTAGMALDSDLSLEDLRKSVTSKAGTTEAGLAKLAGEGTLESLLEATVKGAYERAIELR